MCCLFRLGIEGLVMFKRDTQFDAENYTIMVPSTPSTTTIAVFDKVKVWIEVEKDKNTQRGRVKMTFKLIHPVDSRNL
jgi:exosome complex exonuclease DIS3/RRP44